MTRASGAIGTSPRRVSPPMDFGWDFNAHPVNIYDGGQRKFKTDIQPRSKVSEGIWSGPEYWVSEDGSDENTGTSRATALASLWKARELAQADPAAQQGYSINVIPDPATGLIFLEKQRTFSGSATGGSKGDLVTPSRPFALLCHGGRLVMGPCELLSYTQIDSATNTWRSTGSAGSIAAVYNIAEMGPFGIRARIPKRIEGVSDDQTALAAVQGAQGDAWAQAEGSDKVFIRLDSGEAVSNLTVSVAVDGYGLKLGDSDVYVSGVELVGGCLGTGAMEAGSIANRSLVFEDVGACGAGRTGRPAIAAFGVDDMTGFALFHRCYGFDSLGDIFRFGGSDHSVHALMIDCWGLDAGHPGASPVSYDNHVVCADSATRLISLNTQASYSTGGCVHAGGTAQHWDLGSIYAYDRGDFWLGPDGANSPTGVRIDGNARYWGQDITVAGCEASFSATANARINLRGPVEIGGKRSGLGTTGDY